MLDFKSQNHSLNLKANTKYRAYQFSLMILNLVKVFPQTKIYYILEDQLVRSATSIGANIIEAKSSSSRKDFIKFYDIALKSANETTYWLYLLKDSKLIQEEKLESIIDEIKQLSKMIASSLLTLKNKKI